MNKNNKYGFTLVELLAVIVILAIILVIAVPTIMNTIDQSREGALMSSAKLIAASAETKKMTNDTLEIAEEITCDMVADINSSDYESCTIEFDEDNNALVTIVGKGKFEGKSVCDATRSNAVVSSQCGPVPMSDECFSFNETTGTITAYDVSCGLDVVVPRSISGVKVTAIGDYAFSVEETWEGLGITSIYLPPTIETIGERAFAYNLITSIDFSKLTSLTTVGTYAFFANEIETVKLPKSLLIVHEEAFDSNPLNYLELKNTSATFEICAFGYKSEIMSNNLPDTYECYGM